MSESKSQVNNKVSRGAGRTRVFAIVVYPDSAPSDWRDRLVQEHVSAFISPLHDQDMNPDGSQKKPHYHVLLMFDGVKSPSQVDDLWDRVLGSNRVKHYETVNSTRGYARYLCHMDNPEKAQYDRVDVVSLGGADYDEVVSLPSDDWEILDQIFQYIEENNVRYYSRFLSFCRKERREWFKLISKKYSFMIISYMKSEMQYRKDLRNGEADEGTEEAEDFRAMQRLWAKGFVLSRPDTGEIITEEEVNSDDCQN